MMARVDWNVNKVEKWTRKGLDETHLVVTDELAKKFSQWEKDYYLCLAWNSFHKYPWTTQIRASLHCNKQKIQQATCLLIGLIWSIIL